MAQLFGVGWLGRDRRGQPWASDERLQMSGFIRRGRRLLGFSVLEEGFSDACLQVSLVTGIRFFTVARHFAFEHANFIADLIMADLIHEGIDQ